MVWLGSVERDVRDPVPTKLVVRGPAEGQALAAAAQSAPSAAHRGSRATSVTSRRPTRPLPSGASFAGSGHGANSLDSQPGLFAQPPQLGPKPPSSDRRALSGCHGGAPSSLSVPMRVRHQRGRSGGYLRVWLRKEPAQEVVNRCLSAEAVVYLHNHNCPPNYKTHSPPRSPPLTVLNALRNLPYFPATISLSYTLNSVGQHCIGDARSDWTQGEAVDCREAVAVGGATHSGEASGSVMRSWPFVAEAVGPTGS
jgi:hypothetical protein